MFGLAINVNTTFKKVLTDLSFLKSPKQYLEMYRGLYGKDSAASAVNETEGGLEASVSLIEMRPGASNDTLSYNNDNFQFLRNPTGDTGTLIGLRVVAPRSALSSTTLERTIAVSFSDAIKTRSAAENPSRSAFPIATSFLFLDSSGTTALEHDGLVFIGLFEEPNTKERRIMAFSGRITNAVASAPSQPSQVLARTVSVPIDWSLPGRITAVASRDANGLLRLSASVDGGTVMTSSHTFDVTAETNAFPTATQARCVFGSMDTRTVTGAKIYAGEFYPSTALDFDDQAALMNLLNIRVSSREQRE